MVYDRTRLRDDGKALRGGPAGSGCAGETALRGGTPWRKGGFTLIEILIVISIIALLSSFVLVAVSKGKQEAAIALAKTTVSNLSNALEQYVQDEGEYPAIQKPVDPDENYFPALYNALFGERRPNGPGGRSAPYMQIKEDQVAVWDSDTQTYIKAEKWQIDDPKVDKFLTDPWGNPYIYRCNRGKKRESWMHNTQGADIYSTGPNDKDDTVVEAEKSDDVGNW